MSDQMQYDDAFTLQKVEDEYVETFNYVAGMLPFIQKVIKEVHQHNFTLPIFIMLLISVILGRYYLFMQAQIGQRIFAMWVTHIYAALHWITYILFISWSMSLNN